VVIKPKQSAKVTAPMQPPFGGRTTIKSKYGKAAKVYLTGTNLI
jgi:hypothetical protein